VGLGVGPGRSCYKWDYQEEARVVSGRADPPDINTTSQRVNIPDPPNPNPYRFNVVRWEKHGDYLIAEVHYPDCTNYEGTKLLLYEGVTPEQLQKAKELDPHFSDNTMTISPVARFEPTERGWAMARKICHATRIDLLMED